ncbi:tetratricopeptide repeat protein [Sphingobium sp. CR2-8]|uniref:O-linked N-acetylglucosamine transferase, SPINDLY family protein n=1 Tax=Sphingobium sp. CR2-8 TaxID=1306534 RepID=UPI002DB6E613|nr:tetratricopeptide repeat protein [Sphingobium sp. CR2-8]MEC3909142.1 tetratricopeptide repeat protein [Sphingobium sp. CR2-8]
MGLEAAFSRARNAEKRGDIEEARRLLSEVLAKFPGNRRAADGLARLETGAGADDASALQTGVAAAGAAYAQGDFMQAVRLTEALLQRFPHVAALHGIAGSAWLALDDPQRAEQAFRTALSAHAADAINQSNLGIALRRQGKLAEAERCYREAIRLRPGYAEAHYNLANLLNDQGREDDAVTHLEKALAAKPDYASALYNLGNIHRERRNHAAAIDCYRRALAIRPGHGDAWNNLGSVELDRGDRDAAIAAFRSAAMADAQDSKALINLGSALSIVGALDEAHAAFGRALEIRPGDTFLQAQQLYLEAHLVDWSRRDAFAALAVPQAPGCEPIPPFIALTFEDDPAKHLARAQVAVEAAAYPHGSAIAAPMRTDGKIRIGYFSADFHDHATMHLLGGLLRAHDRERFEIRAYSFGEDDGAGARRKIMAHLDGFFDIRSMTDAEAVDLVRTHQLDIAIDLKGHTRYARPALFAARMAPVQIGYLGYPGSIGGNFLDYIIADAVVIPPGDERHYSEQVIRLPGSYQPNDDQRAIGACSDDRTAMGLPAEGFVFCSFNQNWKIGPDEYEIWMRLLAQVEGSVLWLIRSNPWVETRLRQEAAARGVDPARLVFAEKLPHTDHLARHYHADLFLDSFAVNAHTTASDALWAGLPVLTVAGRQFAARVGASLLTAIGLPELIALDKADYERIAIALAHDQAKLATIKARLAANRLTASLFDTVGYARKIEMAYLAAHRRSLKGLSPASITIG